MFRKLCQLDEDLLFKFLFLTWKRKESVVTCCIIKPHPLTLFSSSFCLFDWQLYFTTFTHTNKNTLQRVCLPPPRRYLLSSNYVKSVVKIHVMVLLGLSSPVDFLSIIKRVSAFSFVFPFKRPVYLKLKWHPRSLCIDAFLLGPVINLPIFFPPSCWFSDRECVSHSRKRCEFLFICRGG